MQSLLFRTGLFLLIFLGTYTQYQGDTQPINYSGQAQLFWISGSAPETSEDPSATFRSHAYTEQQSERFVVRVGEDFEEYHITLPTPVMMSGIRLDPVGHPVHQISLDWVELQNTDQQTVQRFEFGDLEPAWFLAYADLTEKNNNTWTLTPQREDSFLISPAFPEQQVQHILIRMKVSDQSLLSHTFESESQLFWRAGSREFFDESAQQRFISYVDGQFHDYEIEFRNPARMERMRFDPTIDVLNEIELDHMELLDVDGNQLLYFDFTRQTHPWTVENGKLLFSGNGTLLMAPEGNDPFLVSARFDETLVVKKVKVRMRLFQRMSFGVWLDHLSSNMIGGL